MQQNQTRRYSFGIGKWLGLGVAVAVGALGGCSDGSDLVEPPTDPSVMQQTGTSYYHDIKPLMERYCTSCHRSGDIAPFALTDYTSVKNHAPRIAAEVQSGDMPPWLPADTGLPLRYSRKLRPEDKKLLLDWITAGAPAGDASAAPRTDIPAAETELPPRADMVLKAAERYQPDTTSTDDYHCFVFDPKLDKDRFLTAGQVNPDNRAITHHMALFLISPAQADQVRALDVGGKGYPCFGGPGKNISGGLVLAWAPGGTPMRAPAGTSYRIPKGALLVMQMHYNLVANNKLGDHTTVELELGDTTPNRELMSMFVMKSNLLIKAGDANSVQTANMTVKDLTQRTGLPAGDITVYGAFPHMHLLGKRIAVSVLGGPTTIELPHWDFHWQNTYSFTSPFTLKPTDTVQLECDYDNSSANQPVIMGQQLPPREVRWGESTFDEMCITVLTVSTK